jgi:hypothetical protein
MAAKLNPRLINTVARKIAGASVKTWAHASAAEKREYIQAARRAISGMLAFHNKGLKPTRK